MFSLLKGVWVNVWTRIEYKSNKKDHKHVQVTDHKVMYVHLSHEQAYEFPGLLSERG